MKKAVLLGTLGTLLLSSPMCAFAAGDSQDFKIDRYQTIITVDDGRIFGYGQAEASGKDMKKLKVYLELYSDGVFQESDYAIDTEAPWYVYEDIWATNWFNDPYELKGTFKAWAKDGSTITERDSDSW